MIADTSKELELCHEKFLQDIQQGYKLIKVESETKVAAS